MMEVRNSNHENYENRLNDVTDFRDIMLTKRFESYQAAKKDESGHLYYLFPPHY